MLMKASGSCDLCTDRQEQISQTSGSFDICTKNINNIKEVNKNKNSIIFMILFCDPKIQWDAPAIMSETSVQLGPVT